MEITGDPPPSWSQPTTRRRQPPSPISFTPSVLILLPITALLVSLFAVPHFLSTATHILRPVGEKKNWDSLNVVLVSFAILCGVFARRNDDEDTNDDNINRNDNNDNEIDKPSHIVSQQWFKYSERLMSAPDTGVTTLKRSSRSYPNLRQDVWKNDDEDRFRFYDDFELNRYRSWTNCSDQVHELRRTCRSDFEECETKISPVDTSVSPPLSAPSPPPASRHKPRRTYQNDGGENVMDKKDQADRFKQIKSSKPVIPPLPPPLVEMGNIAEVKHAKLEGRRSNPSKEIKMVLASLRKRKKKLKLKDHKHQQECPLHSPHEPPSYYSIIPPPPPPPPPFPSSVFQKYDLFRKCGKSKQIRSVPTSTFSISIRLSKQNTEIPPPPTPTLPQVLVSTKRLSNQNNQTPPPSAPPPESSRRRAPTDSGMPPSPINVNNSYCQEKMSNGGQLPSIPMPPPPPSLPFKIPEFEKTDIDVSSSKDDVGTDSMMDDPDVNAKAETFIARLKDGWKLEKINSMKDKINHITSSEIQQLLLMNK
ncbi:hypothetical protein F3Y22_tig00117011pilonHSYRG00095 [Hibiscus syriacus]|uniref:Uncharacterized protein n=1 Tax=Hibiscus syriacus TaxID=106335 RepID=A0A6A2WF25_HIBSY|nr:histone-lysine N-methyltransferase SETD1A-like [Hibiscus syriacus]KAE8656071.1 hypothetical protein F3Y22_tig00117011pilonHSYRG00095 [Hibiscus syriacus]